MKRLAWISAALIAAACGSDDDANGGVDPDTGVPPAIDADAPGIDAEVPDEREISDVTTAYDGDQEVGPANWDCLGDPDEAEATQNDVEVSGELSEFIGDAPDESEVVAFDSTDFFDDPVAGPVQGGDDYDGLLLPEGVVRVTYRVTAEGHLDTYSLDHAFADPAAETATQDLQIIADGTADLMANSALGRGRTDGLGIVAGDVIDCDGHTVMHAIGALSVTSGELDPPADVERSYYFGGLLPSQNLTETQRDGRFLIPELEPSQDFVYVQAWGYPDQEAYDDDELVLLSEIETTIPDDGLLTAGFGPLRGE